VTLAVTTATWSCLPDIAVATVAPADANPPDGEPILQAVCGDGVVDLDAGEGCDPGEVQGATFGCSAPHDGGGCAIDCPEGGLVDPKTGHCYFVAPSERQQSTANDACRARGAHLVTFTSDEELATVSAWSGWPDAGGVWIGLSLDGAQRAYTQVVAMEPGVSDPPLGGGRCEGCFARAQNWPKTPFPPLALADGGTLRGSCVASLSDASATWFQSPCDTVVATLQTVCERESFGQTIHQCGTLWCFEARSTLGNKRYLYFPTAMTADDAKASCVSLGGRLAVWRSRQERDEIARELETRTPANIPLSVWIGLSNAGGVWTWDDGEVLEAHPVPWGAGEPVAVSDAARAVMRLSSGDYDTQLAHAAPAAGVYPFVCEIPPP
jgi:hypothetical protein